MIQLEEKVYTLKDRTSPLIFFGTNEKNISLIEDHFEARLIPRGSSIKIIAEKNIVDSISAILNELEIILEKNRSISETDVVTLIHLNKPNNVVSDEDGTLIKRAGMVDTLTKPIKPKSKNQEKLVKAIQKKDLVFAIGPAGTGKTYLAVAMAVNFLKEGLVKKIVLCRPAVEAGESLGFLPGDFKEKIDPYLKPLYDALAEMVPRESLKKYFDYDTIEIIPLAYMRGRTLNNSFIILDEAQNSTFVQMKMFLTRLGFNAKAVITGDITQIDLSAGQQSGLMGSIEVLKSIKDISFVYLDKTDVVRHKLVRSIIEAYDRFDDKSSSK